VSALNGTLGIKPGAKLSVVDPPPGFLDKLDPLPQGVELLDSANTGLDVVLLFVRNPAALLDRLPGVARSLALRGRLWVCWLTESPPLDEGLVRHVALDLGMVDDKRASLGGGWLGLRLKWETRPRVERPGERRSSIAGS
jgi:hypothetical protein